MEWIRIRKWWRQHWWPARIRQLDQERKDWKRWCSEAEGNSEMMEAAWGLIANAYGGDWNKASEASGWKVAAERWRDHYHGASRGTS